MHLFSSNFARDSDQKRECLEVFPSNLKAASSVLVAFFILRKGVLAMNNQEVRKLRRKTITIQGRKVTLCFAEHPNQQVAHQVRRVLLSSINSGSAHSKKR